MFKFKGVVQKSVLGSLRNVSQSNNRTMVIGLAVVVFEKTDSCG